MEVTVKRALLVCLVVTLFPITAMAERNPGECTSNSENCTVYDDWDDDEVGGYLLGPNGERLTGNPAPMRRHSLIQVRRNFHDTMLKSVEQI